MCLSHLTYTVLPCLIHTYHVMSLLRPCHALIMPFLSRPRHSTAVERRSVGYLQAFGSFRLPRGVPRRVLSEPYQSLSQRSITHDCKEWWQNTTKKTICYTVGLAVRIFPATTRIFTKDTTLSEQGKVAPWHV